jgi:SAM-dependent methyltransferase
MRKRNLAHNNPSNLEYQHSLSDPYINFVYEKVYEEFKRLLKDDEDFSTCKVLELGAGSITKASVYFPNLTTTDGSTDSLYGRSHYLRAENLPFRDEEFNFVIAKDTLHHFQNTEEALKEISRVLSSEGAFIVSEPYWSILGRVVFRFLHPEKWVPNAVNLQNDSLDPIDANQATLLCLTKNAHSKIVFDAGFSMEIKGPTYGLSYLLSGGLNRKTIIPFKFLMFLFKIESLFPILLKYFSGLNVIVLFKKI